MGINSCGTTLIDQGTFKNIGAVSWDTTAKTAGFTAVAGTGYFVNTTSGAITVTLPSSPTAGDTVGIADYANTADTNNITIGRNGSNIQGVANDFVINTEGGTIVLTYVDATKGWLSIDAAQASDISQKFIVATGGTETTCGDFKIHTFTGPGTFTVTSGGSPTGSNTVDYLVVAGGGGGGAAHSGGGGAGGYRTNFPSPAVAGLPVSVTAYPITVGGGGPGGPSSTSGNPSIFSTITSAGGGRSGIVPSTAGAPGGSGGGGNGFGPEPGQPANPRPGGTGNTPPVSPPQGNNGGASAPGPYSGSGGGGGASAGGSNGSGQAGGAGGNGSSNSISGSPASYAGGGGGGGGNLPSATGGAGGTGGGGAGDSGASTPTPLAVAGTVNTGGGGGGGSGRSGVGSTPGAGGGSGIVIIRYKFQ